MAELAHAHGLRLSLEGYDLPFGDEATYTERADEPMTEFWATGSNKNVVTMARQMASVAHVMGRRIVGAEAFTSGDHEQWKYHPATIKALGDYEFSQGVNRFVVHRYAHQPYLDRFPGVTMGPWGLHYERTQTWWEMSGAWHQYLARCQYLLRQGLYVADLCYLRPEQGDQTGFTPAPTVPAGYRYDECSAEALLTRMSVQNGRLTLPDGMSYRVLVLPDNHGLMTPALLARIKQLIADGATVLGPRPTASPEPGRLPGLRPGGGPAGGGTLGRHQRHERHRTSLSGKGKVIWGRPLPAVLSDLQTAPDFLAPGGLNWIHRQIDGTDVYFVANPANSTREVSCHLPCPRTDSPNSGTRKPAKGRYSPSTIPRQPTPTVPLRLDGSGSAFVVFRSAPAADPVLTLTRNGQPVVPADLTAQVEIKRATYGVPGDATLEPGTCVPRSRSARIAAWIGEHSWCGEMAEGDDPAARGREDPDVVEGSIATENRSPIRGAGSGHDSHFPLGRGGGNAKPCGRGARSVAGGKRSLLAFEPGTYAATTVPPVKLLHAQVTDVPAPLELTGAWELRFPPHWGAPEEVALDQLVSWTGATRRWESSIFPGRPTYTKTFDWPSRFTAAGCPAERILVEPRRRAGHGEGEAQWSRDLGCPVAAALPESTSLRRTAARSQHAGDRRGQPLAQPHDRRRGASRRRTPYLEHL